MKKEKTQKDKIESMGVALPKDVWDKVDAIVGKYGKRSPFIKDAVLEKIERDKQKEVRK